MFGKKIRLRAGANFWIFHIFVFVRSQRKDDSVRSLVHAEFNFLYQFLIHTELIGDLGPLGLVLNTASHHRVHHGANRYCLDKNYAGFLIIWDRLFGTFQAERSDIDIVYGLVDQPQFWNPVKHQVRFC